MPGTDRCRPGTRVYELTFIDPLANGFERFVASMMVRVAARSEAEARRSAEAVLVNPIMKEIPDGAFLDPRVVACERLEFADNFLEIGTVQLEADWPQWPLHGLHRPRSSARLH